MVSTTKGYSLVFAVNLQFPDELEQWCLQVCVYDFQTWLRYPAEITTKPTSAQTKLSLSCCLTLDYGHTLLELFHQFLFQYKNNRTYWEYQFPKEQNLCYSEKRIADMTKIKAMRPRKSWSAIFPPEDRWKLPKEHDYCLFWTNRYSIYSVNSAIGSRIDGIYYSVHSGIRIPPIPCVVILDHPAKVDTLGTSSNCPP